MHRINRGVIMKRFMSLFLLVSGIASQVASASAPVVMTETGALRGKEERQVRAFLGIPYAAPPVGALRWHAPELPSKWTATRDATHEGAECSQTAGPDRASAQGDED